MDVMTSSKMEVESIFFLYDRMFLSQIRQQLSENINFFLENCLTVERQQFLQNKETFDALANKLQSQFDYMDYQRHQLGQDFSITSQLFKFLFDVLISLKTRLESEAIGIKTENKSKSFILKNMPFMTLEMYYIYESVNHPSNREGSLFQQARFICSIDRITHYVESFVEFHAQALELSKSFGQYVRQILKHVENMTKAILFRLQPVQMEVRDESLFIINFLACLKKPFQPQENVKQTHGQQKHIFAPHFNDMTLKEINSMRVKIQDYNFHEFDQMMNNSSEQYESLNKQIRNFQNRLGFFLSQKEQRKIDYSQQMIQDREIMLEDGATAEIQELKEILSTKSELIRLSKKFRQTENNPLNSPLTISNPDLQINKHDIADVVEEVKTDKISIPQFTMSQFLETQQDRRQRNVQNEPIVPRKRGSFQADERDEIWRNFDLSELTIQQNQTSIYNYSKHD